jgi:holo-[acyl-carrier protein] synthase
MIVGIGVDVHSVARMERELQADPEGFGAELLTPDEMFDWASRGHSARHGAELFAAKEALFKALAVDPLDTGAYREVEVLRPAADRAGFLLHGRLLRRAAACGAEHLHLSLASNREVAAAFVVAETTSDPPPSPRGSRP